MGAGASVEGDPFYLMKDEYKLLKETGISDEGIQKYLQK
jgi:hypothetical protein